jgi:hypothetical protein
VKDEEAADLDLKHEAEQGSADIETDDQPGERSGLAAMAASIAGAGGSVISGARRLIDERPGSRVRRVKAMSHDPLPNLWELHPEAHRASIRELGLQAVPVDLIAGTAVEGAGQRGGDFLPLRDRRSPDWRTRWQQILRAHDQLATLPPLELIKFGDQYWVVDGHNRVAAALYNGQVEVDAVVQELRLPGMSAASPALLAPLLEGSLDVRDAAAGRYSRTVVRPVDRFPMQSTSPEETQPSDHQHLNEPETDA